MTEETWSRLVLRIFSSPLKVLSSFSMTSVILSLTSSAAAPGCTVTTTNWGGKVSGKSSEGVRRKPINPMAATSRWSSR